MAIRKPTPASAKSAAMAEILAQSQDAKFKNGSLVEGTVTSVNAGASAPYVPFDASA